MTTEIHPYDIWPPRENFSPPHVVSRWQRELDLLAGLAPNGYPMLRLEWGSVCTWTETNRDLKYLYTKDRVRQTGWGIDVLDNHGNKIKSLSFGLKQTPPAPEPGRRLGIAYPITVVEQIGIPRLWISQYIPPSLVGPWEEVRQRVLANYGADIGAYPRKGIYWKGFHLIAYHGSNGSGRTCCDIARANRVKCFGLYREPGDLDILYCAELWKQSSAESNLHTWTEIASDTKMRKVLMNLNQKKEDQALKEREEMKLRIRDAFKTHKAKLTSRKGKSTFIFTPYGTN